eukprot:g60951.t1
MSGQELADKSYEGELKRVKDLLAQGVSADSKGLDGYPALVNVGVQGHTAVAEALLTARANVHATDPNGWTALHSAGRFGRTETAQALLAAGANIEAKNNAGQTSLDLARENDQPGMAKLLEEAAKLTPEQRSDKAEWKKIEAAVKKAEEDAMSGEQLRKAAQEGNLERVQELLAQRADVETKGGWDNRTALIETGQNGRTDIAQALLAAGANVHAKDRDGYTALHLAGVTGHTATAQALLAAGAQIEAKTNWGNTALDLACQQNKPETIKLLEEAAKVKHVVSSAERGELTAADKSSLDSATEAEYWTPLLFATARGLQTAVQNILEGKASVDKPNKANATALMFAAQHGHTEVGRLLLARKADVNATDQEQLTALLYAAKQGNTALGQALVEGKADVNVMDQGSFNSAEHRVMTP